MADVTTPENGQLPAGAGPPPAAREHELARQNEELRYQLQEAQELIEAVRTGAVDALAIQGPSGPRIFTLEGADQSYRTLIEQMSEGALLLSRDAVILYGNACLAGWLGLGLDEVIGQSFGPLCRPRFRPIGLSCWPRAGPAAAAASWPCKPWAAPSARWPSR